MSGQPLARERQLKLEQEARERQIIVFTGLCVSVAEAIRDLGSVPSGHLYARLMEKLTLEQYEAIIKALTGANIISKDSSHLLTWIGPPKEELVGTTSVIQFRGAAALVKWSYYQEPAVNFAEFKFKFLDIALKDVKLTEDEIQDVEDQLYKLVGK